MKKLKPLLPTLREKKRYLAFEVLSRSKISSFEAVANAVWGRTLEFIGELGAARAGICVIADRYDPQKQRGIIKVSHTHIDELRAALTMITTIQNQEAIVRSLGASGILKKAVRKFI